MHRLCIFDLVDAGVGHVGDLFVSARNALGTIAQDETSLSRV
jgi:hypothetical protein